MSSPLKKLNYGSVGIYTDEILGIGSYGKVCKAKCGQLPCAAKLLHDTMFQDNDPGINRFLERFQQECQFLNTIKHPNIVQFLRTAINPKTGRPVLLMELMDESLTKFLERSTATIFYHSQLNICHDVALALAYLHSNSIIHRDLSSNNVLLIGAGSRAKVTDFGMFKLIDMNPRMTPLTQCPGTTVYMPPEALTSPPHYSNKLDCFSYGVLTVQISTRKFPNPGDATTFLKDSRYPTGRIIVLIPEIERRKKHIELIDPDHPLRPVTLHCLKDIETERPSADDLCERLASLKEERRYTDSVQQSRNQTTSVQRLKLELRQKTEEYQNALDTKKMQYQEAVYAKGQYQRELEQSQLQYREAVYAKGRYQRELEQSQLQYREAVDAKGRYQSELEQSQLQYRKAVYAKRRYQRELEQSQLQYREAVDAKGQYQRELEQSQQQYQEAKERRQRELEQSQLQYQEAVKQHEVQRNMLQHELKESKAREQQLRKELNDMRGQEVLISKERNEAAEGVSHKKSRNVPVSMFECMQMTLLNYIIIPHIIQSTCI